VATNYQKYVIASNPIRAFYENAIEPGKYSGYKVSKDELYEANIRFCVFNDVTPQSKGSFGRVWAHDPYNYESKKGTTRDDRAMYWMGMKLKESYRFVSVEQGQGTIFNEDGES
jgi:hypothetical protein